MRITSARMSRSPAVPNLPVDPIPPHLSAGVTRTLFTAITVPVVAVAVGMHYSPELRSFVDQKVPGASGVLASVTHGNYGGRADASPSTGDAKEETVPMPTTSTDVHDKIPELLLRVTEQKNTRSGTSAPKTSPSDTFKQVETTPIKDSVTNAQSWGSSDPAPSNFGSITVSQKSSSADVSKDLSKTSSSVDPVSQVFDQHLSSSNSSGHVKDVVSKSEKPDAVPKSDRSAAVQIAPSSTVNVPSTAEKQTPVGNTVEKTSSEPTDAKERTASLDSTSNKLARVFGRGQMVESDTKTSKDIIDDSSYKRPSAISQGSVGGKRGNSSANGPSPDKAVSAYQKEIAALKAELESQAKWDAVRLQEAIRAQSVAEKKAAAAKAARIAKQHKQELETIRAKAMADAQRLVETKSAQLEADMIKRRDEEVAKAISIREAELREAIDAQYQERELVKIRERQREIIGLKAAVAALHDDLDHSREFRNMAQQSSKLSAMAFAFKDIVHTRTPLAKYLEPCASSDELGGLVRDSIPENFVRDGVPTVDELKESFTSVSREGRKASLVPQESVGSMWSHFLASVVNRLKVATDFRTLDGSELPPKTDEDRIRRAEKHVGDGDLVKAVSVLDSLGPLPAEIVQDWLSIAKARIAADQGARVLLADAVVSQFSLVRASTDAE